MNKTPVFLICSERSGSNLISQMIGAHSSFYAPPPFHFGRQVLLNLHATQMRGVKSIAWKRMCQRIPKRLAKLLGPQEAEAARVWLAAQEQIDPQKIAEFLYIQATPKSAGKRVFIKENNLHHLMFFILQCFPQAKFIFQVRDPRDYLASAKALKANPNTNKFGNDKDAIRIWKEDQKGGLHALGLLGPERVSLHRYEDLLLDPETVLQKICAFLSIPYEPDMLNFHQSEDSTALAASNRQRKNLSNPLMQSNFAKFRNALTQEEIIFVERRLGRMMHLFGYPLEHMKITSKGKIVSQKDRPNQSRYPRSPLLPRLTYSAQNKDKQDPS